MRSIFFGLVALGSLAIASAAQPADELRQVIEQKLAEDYPGLEAFYKDLHTHPELSLMEKETSAKLAQRWRSLGFEVTEHVGGTGLVAVLKNGPGPTLMLRTDMDALPVHEETGLAYASTIKSKDRSGNEVSVMHACGHDVHMTVLSGAAKMLSDMKSHWSGTLVLIGQSAEEVGMGAHQLIAAGLYQKYPKPDCVVALHDNAQLPAGIVAIREGFVYANVDFVDITVRGVGGHGAYPQYTKDPVVLSARIILALQTIVSRETNPTDPAVVTVGSIHGGSKHNIIPDEVTLQLTLRSYSDGVRKHTIEAIQRICRGEALAAGMPDDRMPVIKVHEDEFTPATYNDPKLTRRIQHSLTTWLGADRVKPLDPVMGGEDFSEYGRTAEKIPTVMFSLGAVAPDKVAESDRTGVPLPSLHSSKFAPLPDPTIRTGVTSLTGVALDLLSK